MSSASPFRRSTPDGRPSRPVAWIESQVADAARFAGFWSAVVLPFALLGLIVSGAIVEQAPLFAVIVAVNVVGLLLGRDHNRE